MKKEITCVIIEDNQVSKEYLVDVLSKEAPEVKVIGTASSVQEGIHLLKNNSPEILFLDIKLGSNYSFEILERINTRGIHIIFISGYDSYRKDAFDHFALGYVTKPFTPYDIVRLINRVVELQDSSPKELVQEVKITNKENWILVHTGKEHLKVKIDDVLYCEADGNYTLFHLLTDSKGILASHNLKYYEEALSPFNFIRINRKELINPSLVHRIFKRESVILSNGKSCFISSRYHSNIDKLIKNFS